MYSTTIYIILPVCDTNMYRIAGQNGRSQKFYCSVELTINLMYLEEGPTLYFQTFTGGKTTNFSTFV